MLTITIDRTALELEPLVITGSRATTESGLWIPEAGYEPPRFEPRRSYAPDSDWKAGRSLLSVVLDQGVLPLVVRAQGTNAADLAAKKATLEHAVTQFVFPITISEDGVARTFTADYSYPAWAPNSPVMRLDHWARASVAIPVNP